MRWFKRHPSLLRKYSQDISSNSNYNEVWQKRNNLFLSCGEIIVRLYQVYKFPILIVYPDATPYVLPSIFLLNSAISEMNSEELTRLNNIEELSDYLNAKGNIKFYYHRHQNSNGTLCLLDSDNLADEEASFYSVDDIIARVLQWFKAFIKNEFLPELPQVEPYAHYPFKNFDFEILYPSFFMNDEFKQGEFYCFPIFHYDVEGMNSKTIFLGGFITSETESRIVVDNRSFSDDLLKLPKGISSYSELLLKSIKEKIELKDRKQIFYGYYFSNDMEPPIFKDFLEIARYINPSSPDEGFNILFTKVKEEIKNQSNNIILGFKYKNRKQNYEWHFIALEKVDQFPWILGELKLEEKKQILNYYRIKAIRGEIFSEESFHARNSKRADRLVLKEKNINIVGCGSIGSEIADMLGKAGIGNINLVDKQIFQAHNSIRHISPLTMIGFPKVMTVKTQIIQHNPFINVSYKFLDITNSNINEYLLNNSITISSIADNNIEGFLNEQAIANKKTIFYVRALRGGKAARIFRVIPGRDACFQCLNIYKNEKSSEFIEILEDSNLPTLYNECNNPVRPASAADLKLISSITARILIDYLQGEYSEINHWVWQTESSAFLKEKKIDPFSLSHQTFIPHPSCTYCEKLKRIKIYLDSNIKESIVKEIKCNPDIETGGIIIGYFIEGRILKITDTSLPGKNAKKERASFIKDAEFCQNFLNEISLSDQRKAYVGEWHYHPSGSADPSNTDLLSLNSIAEQSEYLLDEPIMIIVSKDFHLSCTVHKGNNEFYEAEIEINEERK